MGRESGGAGEEQSGEGGASGAGSQRGGGSAEEGPPRIVVAALHSGLRGAQRRRLRLTHLWRRRRLGCLVTRRRRLRSNRLRRHCRSSRAAPTVCTTPSPDAVASARPASSAAASAAAQNSPDPLRISSLQQPCLGEFAVRPSSPQLATAPWSNRRGAAAAQKGIGRGQRKEESTEKKPHGRAELVEGDRGTGSCHVADRMD
jgi:hypothetical protein